MKKVNCQFCNTERFSAYILRHENVCYLNPLNIRYCEVCNKIVKDYKNTQTCSYACSNTLFRTGSNHGNWKDAKHSYRNYALKHKPLICEDCNYDKIPEILEVHHNDINRKNNKLENLIILCPTCHQTRHFLTKTGRWYSPSKNWSGK